MKVLGRYRMNVYVAGKDVKTTVLIVDGLNEEFIIGMTLIGAQKLHWNPDSREFGWGTAPLWHKGHGKTRATVKLAALTCTTVPCPDEHRMWVGPQFRNGMHRQHRPH